MDELRNAADHRRNRNFAETHRQLIERAVALIGQDGADALSVATLARDAGMNRSTVYYHFDSRDALLDSVKQWVGMRLSEMMMGLGDPAERFERTVHFGLTHHAVLHMWIMDLTTTGDIRERFPFWDVLVGAMQREQANCAQADSEQASGRAAVDEAEVMACVMLSAALMGPRLYKSSVRPQEDADAIAQRFARAYDRLGKSLS